MKAEAVQRVIDVMKKLPADQVDMMNWIESKGSFDFEATIGELAENCNTVGCICGWAVLTEPQYTQQQFNTLMSGQDFESLGAKILGLTKREASRLFYHCEWGDDLFHYYEGATQEERRDLIVMILEMLIKYDGDLDEALEEVEFQLRQAKELSEQE